MRNNSATNITYQGDVNIYIKVGNKQINVFNHNSGHYYLKKIFAMAMAGQFDNTQHTPQLLDIERQSTNGDWQSILRRKISLTNKTYSPTTETTDVEAELDVIQPIAQLQCALAQTDFIESISDNNNYRLCLYTKAPHLLLATTDIKSQNLNQILPSMQATIIWTLRLINKGDL